jgi:uncharacterized protein
MPPLFFGGHEFKVAGGTALFWPAQSALIVADLHLEKGSWFAERGQMLPPYDSLATLERLAAVITQTGAKQVWCLGDNFHDDAGASRLSAGAAQLLSSLTTTVEWHWITGNHDEHLSDTVGGTITLEAEVSDLILRHRADPRDPKPELSGHFHPKYRASSSRGRSVSRPCFAASKTKLILPSFGAFTGGLAADDPAILTALGGSGEALVPVRDRLLRFPLTV